MNKFYISVCAGSILLVGCCSTNQYIDNQSSVFYADAYLVQNSITWAPTFITIDSLSGIVIEFSAPPPDENTLYPKLKIEIKDNLRNFHLYCWKYPIDTVLIKKRREKSSFDRRPEIYYEYGFKENPIKLGAVYQLKDRPPSYPPKVDTTLQMPSIVDTISGRFFFRLLPAHYLVVYYGYYSTYRPWVKDIVVETGKFSLLRFRLHKRALEFY